MELKIIKFFGEEGLRIVDLNEYLKLDKSATKRSTSVLKNNSSRGSSQKNFCFTNVSQF
jgi:hypothetical protein